MVRRDRVAATTPEVAWRQRSRLVRRWRLWRTRHPQTFNEKVRYKMLRDHRELMVTFADKYAVRDYVRSLAGTEVLPRLLHVLDNPALLTRVVLPSAYAIKPTHGSGVAVLVSDSARADARLPETSDGWTYSHVLPQHADRDRLVTLAESWLGQLYGQGPNREWAYGHVPRRILVEEFLTGPDGTVPDDYKFFVFHGACHYIQVDRGRFDSRTQDFYNRDWQHIPMSGGHSWASPPIDRPPRLDDMIRLAELLATHTDFVRVDLYNLAGRLVFGELSSLPAGGDSPFIPFSFDEEFGSHWTPPRRYR